MSIPYVTDIDPSYGNAVEVSSTVRRVVANNPGRFTFTVFSSDKEIVLDHIGYLKQRIDLDTFQNGTLISTKLKAFCWSKKMNLSS